MEIEVPVQSIPQLFFDIGIITEADKIILLIHLENDSAIGFCKHLSVLNIGADDFGEPLTCEGMMITLDIPDQVFESLYPSESDCKSIW